MQKRLECNVSGRVQMVMFRDFTQRMARKLGIVGIVQNATNGNVLIVAEGDEAHLKEFLDLINKGSMFARVDHVEESWSEPLGGYKTFDILY